MAPAPPGSFPSQFKYFLKFRTVGWSCSPLSPPFYLNSVPSLHTPADTELLVLSAQQRSAWKIISALKTQASLPAGLTDRLRHIEWRTGESWDTKQEEKYYLVSSPIVAGWSGRQTCLSEIVTMKWINPTLFNFYRQWTLSAVYQVGEGIGSLNFNLQFQFSGDQVSINMCLNSDFTPR